jgi:hypothetical protein
METKIKFTLNEKDAKHATLGLRYVGSLAADTGYYLENLINAASKEEVEVTSLGDISIINDSIWEYRYTKGWPEVDLKDIE